jgi:hypothetical protein
MIDAALGAGRKTDCPPATFSWQITGEQPVLKSTRGNWRRGVRRPAYEVEKDPTKERSARATKAAARDALVTRMMADGATVLEMARAVGYQLKSFYSYLSRRRKDKGDVPNYRKIANDQRGLIYNLFKQGVPITEIATRADLPYKTVASKIQRAQRHGHLPKRIRGVYPTPSGKFKVEIAGEYLGTYASFDAAQEVVLATMEKDE